MIIDGHAHAYGDYLTPASILRTLDAAKTDMVVLVPGELNKSSNYPFPDLARLFPERNVVKVWNQLTKMVMRVTKANAQFGEGNDFVHELARKLPERVVQFFLIADTGHDIAQELDAKHAAWGFKGLKVHQCWFPVSIDSGLFRGTAEWAEEHDLPVFIHLESDAEAERLIGYKRSHPRLKTIVGHLFGLELFIKSKIEFENLYFDISTFQVTSDLRVLKAVDHFGADKIVLGSDTPFGRNNLRRNIERVERLPLSQDEKGRILGLNLAELLRMANRPSCCQGAR